MFATIRLLLFIKGRCQDHTGSRWRYTLRKLKAERLNSCVDYQSGTREAHPASAKRISRQMASVKLYLSFLRYANWQKARAKGEKGS